MAELTREEAAERLAEFAQAQDVLNKKYGDAGGHGAAFVLACRMGADALLGEQKLIERVAELEQEVDELKELLDDVPEHIIQVRATTFTLKHPLSCRPNLFDCPFNEAGRDLPGPPAPLGCYVVTLDEAGGLIIGEAVDA